MVWEGVCTSPSLRADPGRDGGLWPSRPCLLPSQLPLALSTPPQLWVWSSSDSLPLPESVTLILLVSATGVSWCRSVFMSWALSHSPRVSHCFSIYLCNEGSQPLVVLILPCKERAEERVGDLSLHWPCVYGPALGEPLQTWELWANECGGRVGVSMALEMVSSSTIPPALSPGL